MICVCVCVCRSMDNFLQLSYGDVPPSRAALANRIKRSFTQMAMVGSTFITFTFIAAAPPPPSQLNSL